MGAGGSFLPLPCPRAPPMEMDSSKHSFGWSSWWGMAAAFLHSARWDLTAAHTGRRGLLGVTPLVVLICTPRHGGNTGLFSQMPSECI